MMQTGLVFNVQRYSVHDGPGIRTTVFLKGCPLACAWCHNPEGISARREILVVRNRCLMCGKCREACSVSRNMPKLEPLPPAAEHCTICGECVDACPVEARRLVGSEMTVAEVMREVLRDRLFYEDSGGGVTFSGGEPLMQPRFLRSVLAACKAAGVHTTVDTCGLAPLEVLRQIAPLTDLFLYDLKILDDLKHTEYTGASNHQILENLQALAQIHSEIWLRIPLLPGINTAVEELRSAAAYASGLPGVRQVNLLPFHRTGLHKSAQLGRAGAGCDLSPPSEAQVTQAVEIFRSCSLNVRVGG